jgi:hypothetical protein
MEALETRPDKKALTLFPNGEGELDNSVVSQK